VHLDTTFRSRNVPFKDTQGLLRCSQFYMNALLLRNLTKPEMNFINSRDKYGGEKKKSRQLCILITDTKFDQNLVYSSRD